MAGLLVNRFGTLRPFLKLLVTVVDFDATPEGEAVLDALRSLPDLMGRKKVGPTEIDTGLLTGSWRHLVLSAPHLEPGTGRVLLANVWLAAGVPLRRNPAAARGPASPCWLLSRVVQLGRRSGNPRRAWWR